MKIIYEAFDGKQFDDEWDCYDYEFIQTHQDLFNIVFYNKERKPYHYTSANDDSIYGNCWAILIHNEDEFNALNDLAKDTGWCEFNKDEGYITSPGLWYREEDELMNPIWKKVICEKKEN